MISLYFTDLYISFLMHLFSSLGNFSGYTYSGTFERGRIVGEGTVTTPHGDVIDGHWSADSSCQVPRIRVPYEIDKHARALHNGTSLG